MEHFLSTLNLNELRFFLLSGNPPIYVQLLGINTVLMIVVILRRLRQKTTYKTHVAHILQAVFILGNMFVLFEQQAQPLLREGEFRANVIYSRTIGAR